MRPHPHVIAAVLAAFVTTTAIPGSLVVAHRHEHGALAHVHADLHEAPHHRHPHHHEDDDHDHHDGDHHDADAHADHRDGLVAWDGEPSDHVHVVPPFQPGTRPALPCAGTVAIVVPLDPTAPASPAVPSLRTARSRAPPLAAHV